MRFAHTNIVTKNWKKLADFYISVFDCTIKPPTRKQSGKWLENGTGVPKASLEGVHLLLPGFKENGPTLEIFTFSEIEKNEPGPANKRGFAHIAFEVENVSKIAEEVKIHGGSLLGKITEKQIDGAGIITFVYARDPEGNIIELQSWK